MLFVLSTGRSGSRTISNVLSQSPDMVCTHEPLPRLIEECARYRYGELEAATLAELLEESRPSHIDGRRYGESANRLSPAAPVLAATFPEAQFIWLIRDGREFVASGMQRGWYADAKDTPWERWRLRGDRLGEVADEEWSAWSPFEKVCWLWRRTNEMIRDDLGGLDPARVRRVRLEDLEAQIDDIADFLGIARADWAIGRLNARSAEGRVGEPSVNKVAVRLDPTDWTDEQQATFARQCGDLMDEMYPGWREPRPYPPIDDRAGRLDERAAVSTELAELRVLRGEMNLLVDQVHRVDRRAEKARADRDRLTAEREELRAKVRGATADASRSEAELRRVNQLVRRLEQDIAQRRIEAGELEKRLKKAEREVAAVRGSESFRLGHGIVRVVGAPKKALARMPASARREARGRLRSIAKKAAARPGAARVAQRLPAPIVDRLVDLATGSSGRARSGNKASGHTSLRSGPVVVERLGLRAVVDGDVDLQLLHGLDIVPPDADQASLTHVDLLVCNGDAPSAAAAPLVESYDPVVVRSHDLAKPISPGLTPYGILFDDGELLAVSTNGGGKRPELLLPGRPVVVRSAEDLPSPTDAPEEFRRTMQSWNALVDRADLHAGRRRRVELLVRASATGLPVYVEDPDSLGGVVDAAVLDAWSSFDPRDLTRHDERARLSWRQRRLVHRAYSARAVYDAQLRDAGRPGLVSPSMSVVVASNRPDLASHWSAQLAAQDHSSFEVIWAQHGDGFTEDHLAVARAHLGDRVSAVSVPAAHTLGDALNAATERASGDVIVKWDDDDLYHPGHLSDLAIARRYSGAELVGKAAEFVYLASLDVTIRRFANSTESYSTTIGGPTLTIDRSHLRELGGWRRTRRRVDALLIEDVRAAGGSTYRTSGYGFVMMRTKASGHRHTWSADDDYFLRTSVEQRRGLDLTFAGFEAGASTPTTGNA
jgi:hypothetical protein